MTFKLYHIRQPEGNYLYEYSINDLCGRHARANLNELIDDIISEQHSLLSLALLTIKDFYLYEVEYTLTATDLTPLFTAGYVNTKALKTSLLLGLQSTIPEHLV